MTSKDRVVTTLSGSRADRVPLNVFAGWNPGVRERVEKKYGTLDGFYREMGIDIVTGVLPRFPFGSPDDVGRIRSLDEYLDEPIALASGSVVAGCDGDLFPSVQEAIDWGSDDRAVFAHAWGVFELSQFLFEKDGRPGTQDALFNMAAEPGKCAEIYVRLARWSADCVEEAIHAGVDAIELSDDWGQQKTMLFSPASWHELVFPATKIIVDRAVALGVPILLHSDGDVSRVLDGIVELGLTGIHPVQESAGMSFEATREALGTDRCIMGGLDTITALPSMSVIEIEAEVERIFAALKPAGPFIFAGSHMFQDDTNLEVIEAAYAKAGELAPFNHER